MPGTSKKGGGLKTDKTLMQKADPKDPSKPQKAPVEKEAKKASIKQARKSLEKFKSTGKPKPGARKVGPDGKPPKQRAQEPAKKEKFGGKGKKGDRKNSITYKGNRVLMKASPEKKAAAKAKAIKGGMPQDVANRVFKMQMGSKSMNNSDSTFSMYSEKVMRMSPLFAHEPGHPADPKDKLHSYTQTNTTTSRTGATGSGSNMQKKSTSNLSNYQSGLKDLGPDFKPTAAQTAAANKKVAELKKKDADAAEFNKNISKSSGGSVKTNVETKTKTLGTQTQKDILKEGTEFKSNRKSKVQAERGAAMDRAQKDSITSAQNYIKNVQKRRKVTQKDLEFAARAGDRAGRYSMSKAKGEGGNVLFDKADTQSAFGGQSITNRPPHGKSLTKKQQERYNKKHGKLKTLGYKSTGSLGQVPKISDIQMRIPDKALKYYNRKK